MYSVYFCCYQSGESVSSADPLPFAADALATLLERVVLGEDDYLGILDSNGDVVQILYAGLDRYQVEVLDSMAQCRTKATLSQSALRHFLAHLPRHFRGLDPALSPG
jgi:hypothetical protein